MGPDDAQSFWRQHFLAEENPEEQFQHLEVLVRQVQETFDNRLRKIRERWKQNNKCEDCNQYTYESSNCFSICGKKSAEELSHHLSQVISVTEKVELLRDRAGTLLLEFSIWFTEWNSEGNKLKDRNLSTIWDEGSSKSREATRTILRHCPNQRDAAASNMAKWVNIPDEDFLVAQEHISQELLDAIGYQALVGTYGISIRLLVLAGCPSLRDLAVEKLMDEGEIPEQVLRTAFKHALPEQMEKFVNMALSNEHQYEPVLKTILELSPHRRTDVQKRINALRTSEGFAEGILEASGYTPETEKKPAQTALLDLTPENHPPAINNPAIDLPQKHQRLLEHYG